MYQYKFIREFSEEKVLRLISEYEQDGWELVSIYPRYLLLLGSGGGMGLVAIIRRPTKKEQRNPQS